MSLLTLIQGDILTIIAKRLDTFRNSNSRGRDNRLILENRQFNDDQGHIAMFILFCDSRDYKYNK
jgi:hypothetical protein